MTRPKQTPKVLPNYTTLETTPRFKDTVGFLYHGPGVEVPLYTTPRERFIARCHSAVRDLGAWLVISRDKPDIGWDPGRQLLTVWERAPEYILAHEVAHTWVASARQRKCLEGWYLPEFGLGGPSFVWRATKRMLPKKEVDDSEHAARTLGMLLLTKWYPEAPGLSWKAHLAEGGRYKGQGLNSARGARLLFDYNLIGIAPDGQLLLRPNGDRLDGALRREPSRRAQRSSPG